MRDTVAGPAEMYAVAGAGALQIAMVVGVAKIGLQQIMIDILGGQFDPHLIQTKGLEFEESHGAGGILQQGLVDTDGNLCTGLKPPFQ